MAETNTTSLLQLLKEEFDEEWTEDREDEVFIYHGEHADGVPSIRVDCSWSSVFTVEWKLGWYEQAGDAETAEGVVLLIRAMNAANRALEKALSKEKL